MHSLLARADRLELNVCLRINALSRLRIAREGFRVISRLGDGVLWYATMVILAVAGGVDGTLAMLHVGVTSLLGVLLYSCLKKRLVRPRPYVSHGQIVCRVAPLDKYSFPSGHTLHAVLFTIMLSAYAPLTAGLFIPFAVLVAMSRVVLGVHYPSDVLVGAGLGAALALFSLSLLKPTAIDFALDAAHLVAVWRL